MIFALLDALENPHLWAITRDRDGVIHIAPVDVLQSKGAKIVGMRK